MRKLIIVFAILFGFFFMIIMHGTPADAAKPAKGKKVAGMTDAQITEISDSVNVLTRKIYSRELFSPKDSEDLINIKLTLDMQMDTVSNPAFAPIYYRLGNVYRMRDMRPDAIECYQTVLENFSDTAYAPKVRKELKDLGIVIKEAEEEELPF